MFRKASNASRAPARRLAVCSWSLQPKNPGELVSQVQALGLHGIQFALDLLREDPQTWSSLPALCHEKGILIVSGMFGCGEANGSTQQSAPAASGLRADAAWPENWKRIQATASLAHRLGLKLVTFDPGGLPRDESDPDYAKLQQRVGQVADVFGARSIEVALETGRDAAATLRDFLRQLKRANVGVNLDPANLILSGQGDPIEAARLLGHWIKQVHIRDARRPAPGQPAEEVVVGTGEVDWRALFDALERLNFPGYYCLEREMGEQRVADLRAARQYLERLIS